jgi:CubicO group peptidase (beta-lactamase class C family)
VEQDPLRRFLAARVAEGRMSGASWWVGRRGRAVSRGALGTVAANRDADPVVETTPYDLASLTKPLATATMLLLLEAAGRLDLDATLETALEETRGSAIGGRSLCSLATHTSGLPAWAPLCARTGDLAGYVREITRDSPLAPEGEARYSDLGYILLGAVLERLDDRDLATAFESGVARPLGLPRLGFATGGRRFADAAATERGSHFERKLAGNRGAGHAWRTEIPRGEVHDSNAHALGGAAGHAGLFGTADEVARLVREWLEGGTLPLDRRGRSRLLEAGPRSDGRTVGLVTAARSSAGRGILPDDAPGHTGFTGTSLWCDVPSGACYVLLTNRVHPHVPRGDFQGVRRGFHRLARASLRGAA